MMLMGFTNGLGDSTTGVPVVDSALSFIKGEAQSGAEAAIPEIQAQVQTVVQPYVIASLLFGVAGFVLGLTAFLRTRKA